MSMRRLAQVSLLLAGFAISACTAFYVPDIDDDGVERCNNGEDCAEIQDNRYTAVCVFGEGQPENSDKICSSDFTEINCNPEAYSENHPLFETYDELTGNPLKGVYGLCSDENTGTVGCQAGAGCTGGTEANDNNICQDPSLTFPAINPSEVGGVEIAGQDALDQFCRFYFCDESFVCDTSGAKWTCKPCDPDDEFGSGGCGTLYIEGQPSPVYTSLDNANCSGSTSIEEVAFGPLPDPPTP